MRSSTPLTILLCYTNIFTTVFVPIHCKSYQSIYHDLVLSNDRLQQQLEMNDREHLQKERNYQKECESRQEEEAMLRDDVQHSSDQLVNLQKLTADLKTEIALMEERIRNTETDLKAQLNDQDRLQSVFARLAVESSKVQDSYKENQLSIAKLEDQTDACVGILDKYTARRNRHQLEESIMNILWKIELAHLTELNRRRALKKFAIDVAISAALTISGVGLSYKIGKHTMKAGKIVYKVICAAQGPVGSLFTSEEPKRKQQIVEIHMNHSTEVLSQYSDEEKRRVILELQGEGPDSVLDLDAWTKGSYDNEQLYYACVKRRDTIIQQDLESHPHHASGFLRHPRITSS